MSRCCLLSDPAHARIPSWIDHRLLAVDDDLDNHVCRLVIEDEAKRRRGEAQIGQPFDRAETDVAADALSSAFEALAVRADTGDLVPRASRIRAVVRDRLGLFGAQLVAILALIAAPQDCL